MNSTEFVVLLVLSTATSFTCNLSYSLSGSLLSNWLSGPDNSGKRLRWFNRCMSTVLVITAVWMATL